MPFYQLRPQNQAPGLFDFTGLCSASSWMGLMISGAFSSCIGMGWYTLSGLGLGTFICPLMESGVSQQCRYNTYVNGKGQQFNTVIDIRFGHYRGIKIYRYGLGA